MSQSGIKEYTKDDGSFLKINGKKENLNFVFPGDLDLPFFTETNFMVAYRYYKINK